MESTQVTPYQDFVQALSSKKKIEDKVRHCLAFMREALTQEKSPAFRDFWQAKSLCLTLFKEKLAPRTRTLLWAEYIELSEQCRALKEVLDEQSSFAKEQIELAIDSLESELEMSAFRIQEMPLLEVPSLLERAGAYEHLYKELTLLNGLAGRLQALRKELVFVSIRMKQKNRLFERLSLLGDQIFPRRKELMAEVATLFTGDVEVFAKSGQDDPVYERKEAIKTLQHFAKVLPLSSATFTALRNKLSECWDQVKEQEEEQHKERAEKREILKKNAKVMDEKITTAEEEGLTIEKLDGFLLEMKELALGREEVKALKKRIFDLKKPLEEQEEQRRSEQAKMAREKEEQQLRAQENLLHTLAELLKQADVLSLDALVQKWEALVKEEKTLCAKGAVKAMLSSRLDSLFDHIQEKKWQSLLEEHAGEISTSLHELLDNRHKERRKLKQNLELYRKTLGGSGLGLEESMQYQELVSVEKIRLDTVETMIEEMEEKLFDLEE